MAESGNTMGGYRDPETSEESLLINRLNRIDANPSGFYAVHIHLSKLRAGNRQPHFINIAAHSFDGLVESHEATLFPLSNKDLVLVCGNVPVEETDVPLDKIRGLFGEDPLMNIEDGAFEDNFSTWYDLSQPDDHAAFLEIAKELLVEAKKLLQREAEDRARADRDQGNPLGAMNLAAINQKLQGTRVADLIREQVCLQIGVKGPGSIVFRENYISMADLKKRIAPEVNLFASPWLFQYLTETLDKRVLAVMANKEFDTLADAVSLNLNVGTVLSRDFHNFHRVVGDHARKVVVEMQVLDVFADMNTFGYARDSLQERGYRVLIDGLSPLALQFFDPGLLKADLVKVNWSAEFEGDLDDKRKSELLEVVASTGKDNMILARVDTEDAVKWGLSLGISRFQGFFIDDLMVKVLAVKDKRSGQKAAAKAPAKVPVKAAVKAPVKAAAKAPVKAPAKVPVKAAVKAPATAAPKTGTA